MLCRLGTVLLRDEEVTIDMQKLLLPVVTLVRAGDAVVQWVQRWTCDQ